jgi:outer membrane protein
MAKSIKVAILGALLLPASGLVGAQTPAQSPKFAFVDSRVILQRAPGSAAIQAQIAKERSDAQASVAKMQDSLRAMYDAYLKEQPTLTAAQKEQREKTLQQRNADFDQRVGQLDQDMQKRQFDLIQPMMAQIREVLDAIRNEDSYTFIFDVGNDPPHRAADRTSTSPIASSRAEAVSVNDAHRFRKAPGATKPAPAGVTSPR